MADLPAEQETNERDPPPAESIEQLTCDLKNAIFSKYISTYLIDKIDEMWSMYEKRIEKFLQEKHFDVRCDQRRPQTVVQLEEIIQNRQVDIEAYQRDIALLCSSRKRLRDDDEKQSVVPQANQPLHLDEAPSDRSVRVPKTPRCIDRYEMTDYLDDDLFDDSKRKAVVDQAAKKMSSVDRMRSPLRHCLFQHGEILPLDPIRQTRTIRLSYIERERT